MHRKVDRLVFLKKSVFQGTKIKSQAALNNPQDKNGSYGLDTASTLRDCG